ncbi:MAG: hypothetical protein E7020_03410 [Alphaproteobacteria bacterium]|nr:hypothetical protein [Alphaproteobacteria bacterium]
MIYNKKEYNQYIRQLFSNSTSIEEFEEFELELKKSDQKRRNLSLQISSLTREYTDSSSSVEKRIIANKIATLRQQRTTSLPINELRISRFSVLSNEAKKYACTSALLKKYLTGEIIKNNPLNFETTSSGDIIINFEKMENSHLHELAVDIRDFVSFYFENEGDKIKTANYFLDIYKNVKSIYELNHCIDRYYDKKRQDLGDYISGRTDVIQVENYPDQKLQLMRIIGPEGLNFESDNMGHCIRRERYVEKLNTTAEYYSLRNMKRGRPNYPFVTIYFNEGELLEVVGKSNHAIADLAIVDITRQFIKSRLGLSSDKELLQTDKIPEVAKRNMGIVKDKSGIYRDLYNIGDEILYFQTLPVTAHNLGKIKLQNIHADTVWLQGNYTPKTFDQINRLASFDRINIATQFNFGSITKLDLSKLKVKKLNITNVQLRDIQEIIFPNTLEELDANTLDFKKIRFLDMRNCKNLYSISFRNADLTQTNTVFIPRSIRKIDIDYARLSRPLNYRLNYIQNLLNTSRNNVVAILFKRSSKEPSL